MASPAPASAQTSQNMVEQPKISSDFDGKESGVSNSVLTSADDLDGVLPTAGAGWFKPPPADHHPFSDIVWFS
jgi:hypothetical protein